jgi:hypothetical protein
VIGRVVRLAVAVLGVAAAGLAVPGPAQAATCSPGSGVTVVVDYHQLGGGHPTSCDAGGAGETADDQFGDAGFTLVYVQQQPGFVCRVDGKPTADQDPCVRTPPSNAYWSLWWSDGTSGKWTYASTAVTSLKVPDGGSVALSWQQGSGRATPGVAPPARTTSNPSSGPTSAPPSAHPSHGPTQGPSSDGPGAASSGPATGSSTGSTTGPSHDRTKSRQGHGKGKAHRHHAGKTPDASPDASVTARAQGALTGVDAGGPDGSGGSGGLPAWVAPLAIVVLFAGAGGFVVARRKTRGGA